MHFNLNFTTAVLKIGTSYCTRGSIIYRKSRNKTHLWVVLFKVSDSPEGFYFYNGVRATLGFLARIGLAYFVGASSICSANHNAHVSINKRPRSKCKGQ